MTGTWSSSGTWSASSTNSLSIRVTPPVSDNPLLVGDGPPECSSSTALSVLPGYIFDVNGYYRDLGVATHATRKQLRLAYQAKNGQSSVRLTYVLSQLLNPEVRREYDLMPLGSVFMDEYVLDALNRKLKDEMSRRMAHLHDVGVNMDEVDTTAVERDILADLGYQVADESLPDTPDEVVDDTPDPVQDEPDPAKFEYAFYAWRTHPRLDAPEQMREWQHQLVRALSNEGVALRFAVGVHGIPHPWVQATVGYRTVFFIGKDEDPTPELAAAVARRVRLDREAAAPPTLTGR